LEESKFKSGDIIFQESESSQSKAIQLATHSKYSHCGIIYKNNGKTYVLEAVQPVKLTTLDVWINRGKNKHFVLKRFNKSLNEIQIRRMQLVGQKMIGKPYDFWFNWSDDKIYCSELVWKIYYEGADIKLSELEKIGQFNLNSREVRNKLIERYSKTIPLGESVVSPASLFNSKNLVTVNFNHLINQKKIGRKTNSFRF
jgi:uncharacterized protein YycO